MTRKKPIDLARILARAEKRLAYYHNEYLKLAERKLLRVHYYGCLKYSWGLMCADLRRGLTAPRHLKSMARVTWEYLRNVIDAKRYPR